MKVKIIKPIYKNKLTELQILKSRIYKKNDELKTDTNKIQLYLKKIMHLIYEFHVTNKKILFLNFPEKFEKKITRSLKQSHHIFINNENFLNGIISNQKISLQQSNQLQKLIKNNLKNKIPIKKFIDLIIIFNPVSELNSDKKLYISQIPTITINENLNNNLNLKQNYKLIGNFKFIEKQISNNICLSILKAIFKNTTFKKQKSNIYKQNIKKAIKIN